MSGEARARLAARLNALHRLEAKIEDRSCFSSLRCIFLIRFQRTAAGQTGSARDSRVGTSDDTHLAPLHARISSLGPRPLPPTTTHATLSQEIRAHIVAAHAALSHTPCTTIHHAHTTPRFASASLRGGRRGQAAASLWAARGARAALTQTLRQIQPTSPHLHTAAFSHKAHTRHHRTNRPLGPDTTGTSDQWPGPPPHTACTPTAAAAREGTRAKGTIAA